MKNFNLIGISAALLISFSCSKNPFTGSNSLALVSNNQILPSAFEQYNQFLSENKVISGTADAKRVELLGLKLKMLPKNGSTPMVIRAILTTINGNISL